MSDEQAKPISVRDIPDTSDLRVSLEHAIQMFPGMDFARNTFTLETREGARALRYTGVPAYLDGDAVVFQRGAKGVVIFARGEAGGVFVETRVPDAATREEMRRREEEAKAERLRAEREEHYRLRAERAVEAAAEAGMRGATRDDLDAIACALDAAWSEDFALDDVPNLLNDLRGMPEATRLKLAAFLAAPGGAAP